MPQPPVGVPLRPPTSDNISSERTAASGLSLRAGGLLLDTKLQRLRARDLAVAVGAATVAAAALLQKPSALDEANAAASAAMAAAAAAATQLGAEAEAAAAAAATASALAVAADSGLWHAMTCEQVLSALGSSEDGGLSAHAAANRLAECGHSSPPFLKNKSTNPTALA
jgi:hypothetical protein